MNCSRPSITNIEKVFVEEALKKADIGIGEYIGKFEEGWAKINNKKYGVACNSGTNALFLALKALGIGKGDEVIVPEFTMVATAWAVSYTGATPVFADCLDDLTLDPNDLKMNPKIKAIIPTAIYGRSVCDRVFEWAKFNNLFIIEDLAEGHGIAPRGDIACYSFYGNKIITTGEGGMCLTDDERVSQEIRKLANMYFDAGRTLIHPKIGYNFRLTNIQAAIGVGQLQRFYDILASRKQIESWYNECIAPMHQMPIREVVWFYDINCGDKQEEVKKHLAFHKVETRYFFKPMSMQPMYNGNYRRLNAYKWSKRGLYLPVFIGMTKEDVKFVSRLVNDILD